jgi:hypothetical protein
MVEEARLEAVESGLAPVSPGWFVVNARDAAWMKNGRSGGVCIFESDDFVLRGRPDLDEYVKPEAGFVLRVLKPGRPAGMYHAESVQEDFLVLMGECILIVEDEERHLRAWGQRVVAARVARRAARTLERAPLERVAVHA